jgi:DNA-binding NarL/FixJ family response regulator
MAHILLIEGHRMMRGALKELLEQGGAHCVESASDPVVAVQIVMRMAPETIVLDTSWTEINGVCLSRMLRALAPHAKIVLLVDEEWPDDEDLRRSSGADEFVTKNMLMWRLPEALGTLPLPAGGRTH